MLILCFITFASSQSKGTLPLFCIFNSNSRHAFNDSNACSLVYDLNRFSIALCFIIIAIVIYFRFVLDLFPFYSFAPSVTFRVDKGLVFTFLQANRMQTICINLLVFILGYKDKSFSYKKRYCPKKGIIIRALPTLPQS